MPDPTFDVTSAHKYFSVACFNKTWEFLDQPQRTKEEEQEMLLLSMTSLWHWTQRADCAPNNLFGGNWQISRVQAVIGNAEQARHYGKLALKHGAEAGPFHEGYGHEALARAALVAGDREQMRYHVELAKSLAEKIPDPEHRKMLLSDLAQLS